MQMKNKFKKLKNKKKGATQKILCRAILVKNKIIEKQAKGKQKQRKENKKKKTIE